MMLLGTIGAVVASLGMPIFALLFKKLLNSLNPTSTGKELYSKLSLPQKIYKKSHGSFLLLEEECGLEAILCLHSGESLPQK